MDEWTSLANRKYLNMNLHYHDEHPHHNLGLTRAIGSHPAAKIKKLVTKHLGDFDHSLKQLVAVVSDGASVCVKFGKSIECLHLLCVVHGINLAIVDVLFVKDFYCQICSLDFESKAELKNHNSLFHPGLKNNDTQDPDETQIMFEDENTDEIEVKDEDIVLESDGDALTELEHSEDEAAIEAEEAAGPDLLPRYRGSVKKSRGLSGKFRNSHIRNEVLQKILSNNDIERTKLQLDVKTRWNSTLKMISVFLPIVDEIHLACSKLKIPWTLDEGDIKLLRELERALEPFEFAINQLGARGVNLIQAEVIYKQTVASLNNQRSEIATKLKESFLHRIDQRRNANLVHLMLFLRDPTFLSRGTDWLNHPIVFEDMVDLAHDLIHRLFPMDVKVG